MADKYVQLVQGGFAEQMALTTSRGSIDSGRIPGLDTTGRLSETFLPVGVGADVQQAVCFEAISAGNLVQFFSDNGTLSIRKADASNSRRAMGFVKASGAIGNVLTVYTSGLMEGQTSIIPGASYYLSGVTAGTLTATAPTTSGFICQEIGVGISTTSLTFSPQQPVRMA